MPTKTSEESRDIADSTTHDPKPGDDAAAAHALIESIERQGTRHAVDHLGRKLVWRRFGDGPPVVLLHGGHGSWLHWLRNIERLSAQHTVWLPDMPGFGDSDSLPGPPHAADRMPRLLDALHASLNSLAGPDTPIDLAGFSFGGLVAANLASGRPTRRMALVGPGGHDSKRREITKMLDWRKAKGEERIMALRQNLSTFMFSGAHSVDALSVAVYETQCLATRFRSKSISRAGGLHAALNRYSGPLMLIWGEHDVTATPTDIAPRLAEGRDYCEWHIVPGAGHWAQFERGHEVTELIENWFRIGGP